MLSIARHLPLDNSLLGMERHDRKAGALDDPNRCVPVMQLRWATLTNCTRSVVVDVMVCTAMTELCALFGHWYLRCECSTDSGCRLARFGRTLGRISTRRRSPSDFVSPGRLVLALALSCLLNLSSAQEQLAPRLLPGSASAQGHVPAGANSMTERLTPAQMYPCPVRHWQSCASDTRY